MPRVDSDPTGAPPNLDQYGLPWWLSQSPDALFQQRATAEFASQSGEDAKYAQDALRAAAQSGLLGAGTDWITRLRDAFTSRKLADPFAALPKFDVNGKPIDPLALATASSQTLNKAETTPFAQAQRKLYEQERGDVNDLAARGILQSGETGYRNDRRGIMQGQLQGGVLQDTLDRIEGFNQGRLAAMNQHRDNLWSALQSATGRQAKAVPAGTIPPTAPTVPAAPIVTDNPPVPFGLRVPGAYGPFNDEFGASRPTRPLPTRPVIPFGGATNLKPGAGSLGVPIVPQKFPQKVSGAFAGRGR